MLTGLLFFLLLAVPLLELYVVIEVWQQIGGFETIFLLIAISIAGAWLVKREGLGVWLRFNQQLAKGELPTNELIDGALILFAGALMLTPGFITDGVGLLLLFPLTRAGIRRLVRVRLNSRLEVYAARGQAFGGGTGAGGAGGPGVRFVTFGTAGAPRWTPSTRGDDIIDVTPDDGDPPPDPGGSDTPEIGPA